MRTIRDDAEFDTPWEFLPVDDDREPCHVPAEERAIHVTRARAEWDELPGERTVVVHYFDDEDAEIPDPTIALRPCDHTETVHDLLVRQHYVVPAGGEAVA